MNNKSTYTAIGAAILSVFAVIGTFAFHPKQTVVQHTTTQKVGTANDLSNTPQLLVNGVSEWYTNVPFNQGTTTLCSLQNPLVGYAGASSTAYTATTTLQYVSYHITQGIGSQSSIEIATSTNAQGTTSDLVSSTTVPASSQFVSGWIAPSWYGGIFRSGDRLNVVVSTTSTSTMLYQGYCQAEWTAP